MNYRFPSSLLANWRPPAHTVVGFMLACFAAALSISSPCSVLAGELSIAPKSARLSGPYDRIQMVVTDVDAAGTPIDVTKEARIENAAPELLSVDSSGQIRPLADGETTLKINFGNRSVDLPVSITGSQKRDVSFRNLVMPILAKAGCNQGACHASQFGKGDLKLSLLGYAPEQDHPALVRDRHQRRVSLVRPDDSLLLKKATLDVSHGGGLRFRKNSVQYQIVRDWIASGAPAPVAEDPAVTDLKIFPARGIYSAGHSQQLRVIAVFADGSERDVSHLARYDSMVDSVAAADRRGHVQVHGRGQAAIMIRYEGQATVFHVLSPFSDSVDLSSFTPVNFVDEKVRDHWQRLGVVPSEVCSDAHFIRRVFLDSIGTLPTSKEVREFLASRDPDKRGHLVDELLGLTGDQSRDVYVNEWSAWWTLKWGDLLRINRNQLGDGGMWSFSNWVRNALRKNMPMDEFVRQIITAQGSIYQNGPANYFKTAKTPTDLAETTAQIFLGVRLQCAKCHHHPFEVYSQADYYGLAAFFTRVGNKTSTDFGALGADTIVKINTSGSIRHPRTRVVMEPAPLLQSPVDTTNVRDLRRPLAEWLTAADNRLFARNIVNRVWGYYMGYGLVEPIDDMRATNPASNPELLKALAQNFVDSGFDLRQLMKSIMVSRVYQLDCTPRPENTAHERLYVHYNVKRMPAEALLDAIDFSCGTQERFAGVPLGTRAIELPDPNYASYFLDTLGRPKRVITCECERTTQPNLAQVLHIANGEVVNRKLSDKAGRLTQLEKQDVTESIQELYLVTLSRLPTTAEIDNATAVIAKPKSRREGLENLLWALINSREFMFIH